MIRRYLFLIVNFTIDTWKDWQINQSCHQQTNPDDGDLVSPQK
jgi:hypothetical protein